MIRYRIVHRTSYAYADSVALCQNVAHLQPRDSPRQTPERSVLRISPEPAVTEERLDYFGNPTTYFSIQEPHRELVVTASHRIGVTKDPTIRGLPSQPWETVRDRLSADRSAAWLDAYQFAFDSRYCPTRPEFAAFAASAFTAGRPILDATAEFTRHIYETCVYDPRATTIITPVSEVLENRRGVCQDFAHLQIASLRSLGLAVRYVSGYLSTQPPPGRPRMVGADASHAWISVFCGDEGWVDFDPTNNQETGDRHILLAWGRDYDDVSPLKGVILGGGHHTIRVSVDVTPVEEIDSLDGGPGAA